MSLLSRDASGLAEGMNVVHTRNKSIAASYLWGAMAMAGLTLVASAQPCGVSYSASLGTFPQAQGWTLFEDGYSGQAPMIAGGALFQDSTGSSGDQQWRRADYFVPPNTPITVEFDLLVESADQTFPGRRPGWQVYVSDSARNVYAIGISTNPAEVVIIPNENSAQRVAMPFDASDGFHRYVFIADAISGRLHVDGRSLTVAPAVSGGFFMPNFIAFGDGTSAAANRSRLRFLRAGSLVVDHHPANQSTCPSGTATFSITAAGSGPFTYQWQWRPTNGQFTNVIDGVNTDPGGGPIRFTATGARAGMVTIESISGTGGSGTANSHWDYRVIVTNACGSVTSNAATLTICVADTDDGTGTGVCDGGVTIEDLLYYLRIFDQGLVAADVDDGSATGTPDGGVTIEDLLYYLARFDAGC